MINSYISFLISINLITLDYICQFVKLVNFLHLVWLFLLLVFFNLFTFISNK